MRKSSLQQSIKHCSYFVTRQDSNGLVYNSLFFGMTIGLVSAPIFYKFGCSNKLFLFILNTTYTYFIEGDYTVWKMLRFGFLNGIFFSIINLTHTIFKHPNLQLPNR